jgi:hypothetical protein
VAWCPEQQLRDNLQSYKMSHIKMKYALGGLDIDEQHHMTIKCKLENAQNNIGNVENKNS